VGAWIEILWGAALLASGALLGVFLARADGSTRERIAQLEEEIRRERGDRERYQERVAEHFDRTSDLFRDLTERYRNLYDHLAEGATDLAAERRPALGQGFGAPPLPAGKPAEESAAPPEPRAGNA
jgi:uncharacterized membrane-anchored protein YhcB (DUF1043 family)